jgi:hypothetical protein
MNPYGKAVENVEQNQRNAFRAYQNKQIDLARQKQTKNLEKIEDNEAKDNMLKEKGQEISQLVDGSTLGLFLTKSMGEKLYGNIRKRFKKKLGLGDEADESTIGGEEINSPLDFLRNRVSNENIPEARFAPEYAGAPATDQDETMTARELNYPEPTGGEYADAPIEAPVGRGSIIRSDYPEPPLGGEEGELIPSLRERINPETGLDDFGMESGLSNLMTGSQQPNLFQRFKRFVNNRRNRAGEDQNTEPTGGADEDDDFFGNLIDNIGPGERAFPNLPRLADRSLGGGEFELPNIGPDYTRVEPGESLRSDFFGRTRIEAPETVEPANTGELNFEPELQDLPEGFRDTRIGQYGFRGANPEAESKMPEMERIPSDRAFNRDFGPEYRTADPTPEEQFFAEPDDASVARSTQRIFGGEDEEPGFEEPVEGFRPPEPDYPPPSYESSTRSSRLTDEGGFGETKEPESYGEAIQQKEGTMVKDLPESNVVEGTTIEKAPITAEPVEGGIEGELTSGIEDATGVGATEAGELATGDIIASAIPVIGEGVLMATALGAGAYSLSKMIGGKFQKQKANVADATQNHINQIQATHPHLQIAGNYVGGNTAGSLQQLSQGGSGF